MTTLHEGLDNGTGASLSISTGCFADEGRCLYIGTKEGRLFRVSAPQTPPEIRQLSDAGYKLDCSISQVDLGAQKSSTDALTHMLYRGHSDHRSPSTHSFIATVARTWSVDHIW